MANLAAHFSLLATDLATSFTCLLHTHYRSTPQALNARCAKSFLKFVESQSLSAWFGMFKTTTRVRAVIPGAAFWIADRDFATRLRLYCFALQPLHCSSFGKLQFMYVLLFDIDGTLLNSGGAGQAAMEAAFRREFGKDGPVSGISTAGRTDYAIGRDLFAFYGLEWSDSSWRQFQQAYLELLPEHLSGREGLVLPGVLHLLEMLSLRDDVAVGLLTGNFHQGAVTKLRHFALDHHFAFGGYGDHHASRDDVARVALAQSMAMHPGIPVERTWVIGDTPADVQCARAIGAKAFAVATGMYPAETLAACQPDLLRASLAAPEEWLPQLLPAIA